MTTNEQLLNTFYTAFAKGDFVAMSRCYAPNVQFRDPVFGVLHGEEVAAMWQMLLEKSKGSLSIQFADVSANEFVGKTKWIATYPFSATNKVVVNKIQAQFQFENGLISKHTDDFDLYKWSKQAFGFKGTLLGWTGFFQKKLQQRASASLRHYMQKRSS
ncbi:nuclear transport factor 2 family protein [Flavobacterium sp. K77]|uniref:nuclear transport factor 2 family protein n=1 Tax=Flavobacterium sp. K77 TaxID=2910676 RepID=UPI001F3F7335|nr:nuclear transport factor 2 family protein [Flavobacterium sp. K77]MCF6141334.1 nuclear transport factor 2 family protein [Flavobacterium sp. K77]